jgi:monoamine oxidase
MANPLPVAIIGAGIAGLTAAFHLTKGGRKVRVFEARGRVGGRILSVAEPGCPLPIEVGAEFVHGAAEPVLALADATDTALQSVRDAHTRYVGGAFRDMNDLWTQFCRTLHGAEEGSDTSIAEFLSRKAVPEADAALVRLVVEGFDAAPVADVSAKSIAAEAAAMAKDESQFRPHGGYGDLLRRLLERIDPELFELELNTVVERVDWRPGGACTLRASRESGEKEVVRCDKCVVAVPLGVLQASAAPGAIQFAPSPAAILPALDRLAMGQVQKLVLVLRDSPWMRKLPDSDFMHFDEGAFPTFWQRSADDLRMITAWAGGTRAKELGPFDTRDLIDQACQQLAACCDIAPVDIREGLLVAHHHDFVRDPFSRGAYPYARPGGVDCYASLGKPVEGALFFAGDAADADHFGTAAGATASGARAARQILAA